MAIQLLIHENNNDSKDNLNLYLYVTGMHLINLLSQWTKSLSKAILIQRQKHGIKMSQIVSHMSNPYEFLDSTGMKEKLNWKWLTTALHIALKDETSYW